MKDTNDDLKDLNKIHKDLIERNIFADGYCIIPNRVLNNNKLAPFSIVLYGFLSSLGASTGYSWATNEYLANHFNVSIRTIVRSLAELDPYVLIVNKMSSKRQIWVNVLGSSNVVVKEKKKAKKVIKTKEVVKFKYSMEDLFSAEYLLSKIIYNFPLYGNKKVNINEWAEEMRKLREIDKATNEQIYFMITWVHGGTIEKVGKDPRHFKASDFWAKNILSAKKMRKQWFENLIPQLQSSVKKTAEVQL